MGFSAADFSFFKTMLQATGWVLGTTSLMLGQPAKADSLASYCVYAPNQASEATLSMPCTFSQRQGYVDIYWADGVTSSFAPVEDRVGTYVDERGGLVYRQQGRNGADLIFQLEAGQVLIYWGGVEATDYGI